jgi:2-(1,2-epoxy-1,2-dihydrophenyl)acetyl-CoA isomerase
MTEPTKPTGPSVLELDDDGVRTLVLNRPHKRNAMDRALLDQLRGATLRASEDRNIGAVILTGAGTDFSVGGDVGAMAEGGRGSVPREQRIADLRHAMETSAILFHMPKPVVAVIRGAAAGAGLALALACDIRLATATSKFTTAFAKVGLSGDYGGSWLLTQVVGPARAREMYLLPEVISGARAFEIGLVSRLEADETLDRASARLARTFADGPRLAYSLIKDNLALAARASLDDVLDREVANHITTSLSDDHSEAARAFVERRPPVFSRERTESASHTPRPAPPAR